MGASLNFRPTSAVYFGGTSCRFVMRAWNRASGASVSMVTTVGDSASTDFRLTKKLRMGDFVSSALRRAIVYFTASAFTGSPLENTIPSRRVRRHLVGETRSADL